MANEGIPGWAQNILANDETAAKALVEIWMDSFGKKNGATLKFGGDPASYTKEFSSITVLEDNTTFTVSSFGEPSGSDAQTSAITWSKYSYIVGRFKSITVTAGQVRIN